MNENTLNQPLTTEVWPASMTRSAVVNAVLSLFEKPRYLEVGVNTGETFFAVSADHKVAVDPVFRFDVRAMAAKETGACFHAVESDVYFGSIASPWERFDVIYLDGLHTLEQTLRDFCNAIAYLKHDGVIIIDDVVPNSYHASLPDLRMALDLRAYLRSTDGSWMGDVYRLVLFIDTFFQQFSHATVIENHGQLIVWPSRRDAERITRRRVEEIGRAPFDSVVSEAAAFNRMPFGRIMTALRSRGSVCSST